MSSAIGAFVGGIAGGLIGGPAGVVAGAGVGAEVGGAIGGSDGGGGGGSSDATKAAKIQADAQIKAAQIAARSDEEAARIAAEADRENARLANKTQREIAEMQEKLTRMQMDQAERHTVRDELRTVTGDAAVDTFQKVSSSFVNWTQARDVAEEKDFAVSNGMPYQEPPKEYTTWELAHTDLLTGETKEDPDRYRLMSDLEKQVDVEAEAVDKNKVKNS